MEIERLKREWSDEERVGMQKRDGVIVSFIPVAFRSVPFLCRDLNP